MSSMISKSLNIGRVIIIAGLVFGVMPGLTTHVLAAGSGDYSSSSSSSSPAVINKAKKAINKNDFAEAYSLLSQNESNYKNNADLYNLMGFSARKLGQYDKSMQHYKRALDIDPKHKGALEYMGELYLTLDQPDEAKALLARLKTICPFGCNEKRELTDAIAAWEANN